MITITPFNLWGFHIQEYAVFQTDNYLSYCKKELHVLLVIWVTETKNDRGVIGSIAFTLAHVADATNRVETNCSEKRNQ